MARGALARESLVEGHDFSRADKTQRTTNAPLRRKVLAAWADGDKKGGLAMQCDKNEYRGILAGLEGVTGKKAVDTDTMNVKN